MEQALFQEKLVDSERIVYTPSPFAKTNLIHLQEVGVLKSLYPHISRRERLSSYLFFLVLEGSGTVEYASHQYDLHPGCCVFLDCQKTYSHCTSGDLWKLRWVHFYGPNMNGIYEKYGERGGLPCFCAQDMNRYDILLREIHSIAASDIYIRDMKIFEKLASLLTILMEESWEQGGLHRATKPKRDMQPVKEYLDKNFMAKISLEQLAADFYINKFYLAKNFKEQFGITIVNYLIQVRITHAKQLLRFSDLPIEQIGVQCGVEDPNYFARLFRKVEGIAPGEFRNAWARR